MQFYIKGCYDPINSFNLGPLFTHLASTFGPAIASGDPFIVKDHHVLSKAGYMNCLPIP